MSALARLVTRVTQALLLLGLLVLGSPVHAQDSGSEETDREEAEFRRRMELEDEDDDADISRRPGIPDIIDVDPLPVPEDPLPPDSREHLEAQLRELIIENGRWEPADAATDAPYVPSEAAETDPELQAEEAAEWEAMVAAYHAREQTAYEQASGNGGAGQGSGPGGGAGSGAGNGSGSGSSGMGEPAQSGAAGGNTDREPEDASFSAMDFIGGSGNEEAVDAEPSSGVPGGGPPGAPEDPQNPDAGRGGDSAEDSTQPQTPPGEDETPSTSPPPESDAVSPDASLNPEADAGGAENGESGQSSEVAPGDGSISMENLEALFPAAAGDEEAPGEATEAQPPGTGQANEDSESGSPGEPESAAQADSGNDSGNDSGEASGAQDSESTEAPSAPEDEDPSPQDSQQPPEPENPIIAWLRKLFGGP